MACTKIGKRAELVVDFSHVIPIPSAIRCDARLSCRGCPLLSTASCPLQNSIRSWPSISWPWSNPNSGSSAQG